MRTLRLPFYVLLAVVLTASSLTGCSVFRGAAEEAEETGEEVYEETSEFASDLFDDDDYLAVEIEDTEASGTVTGVARFAYDDENGETVVQGRVEGLSPGLHGFHVHENGSCAMQDGTPAGAAGGHYNPDDSPHGAPDDPADERHVGDFGNIRAGSDGVATFQFSYDRDEDDFGDLEERAIMIHQGRDDLRSQPSGDAGSRVGCGLLTDPRHVDDDVLDAR